MTDFVDFDNFTEEYNALLHEGTQFFSENESYFAKYKINILKQNIPASFKRILEYGCGIGRNIPFLQEAFPNCEIIGSDISQASLNKARSHYPTVTFFHEDELEKNQAQFDLIFVAGVYHHLPLDVRTSISRRLYERLTSEGQVIIFEHNPYNPITRHIVKKCPYDKNVVLLKPHELKNHLQQVGFRVEKLAYCLFVPPRFAWLSWLENYLTWLPLGGQYWIHATR